MTLSTVRDIAFLTASQCTTNKVMNLLVFFRFVSCGAYRSGLFWKLLVRNSNRSKFETISDKLIRRKHK